MHRIRHSVTLACLLAAGCASPPPRGNTPTIKSLEEQGLIPASGKTIVVFGTR